MNKPSQEKYITEKTFKKEITGLHKKIDLSVDRLDKKIDSSVDRLDKKINGIAISLLETKNDVRQMKETTATKDDIRIILDRIDYFSGRTKDFEGKAFIHDHRLNELEPKVENHEKRLVALESPR